MNKQPVTCDERTDAVAGTSARVAFLVVSFGLLIIALVRTLAFRQACLDLLGLYLAGFAVYFVYARVKHVQVISWRVFLFFALAGAVFGVAASLLRRYF
jgi:hypothetical protein